MAMVILPASTSLQKNLLTNQTALSAISTLVGLFLSMLCAVNRKLELLAMTNYLTLKTLRDALSNSSYFIMLAAASSKPLV